jgi:site-specific DNA-cytosine methylase
MTLGCVLCCRGHVENELVATDDPTKTLPVHSLDVDVTVDEVFCGIGSGRSVARRLDYRVVSAIDSDPKKVKLYNATCLTGEVRAVGDSVESVSAHDRAKSLPPVLLSLITPPCWDLSTLGSGDGIVGGVTSPAFKGLFERLSITRPPLVVIEEVDALLFDSHKESYNYIKSNLQRLGYHWRVRILDSSKFGASQQRFRAFIVAALDLATITSFRWPTETHKARVTTFAECMELEGEAPQSLFINTTSKVAVALARTVGGLRRPTRKNIYSRLATVFNGVVHVLQKTRACAATFTASRSSGQFVWERERLRHISGREVLRFFTFTVEETNVFVSCAEDLHISSLQLAEMGGDSVVVILFQKIAKSLVGTFSRVSPDAKNWAVK